MRLSFAVTYIACAVAALITWPVFNHMLSMSQLIIVTGRLIES